jgi:hypothetical protein
MERDVDDLIEQLHDSPVGTEDPNLADPAAEPHIVTPDPDDPADTHAVP